MTDNLHLEKQAGDVVFREGDPVDHAYILEKGAIEISVERGGQSVVICELGPGAILGEMAVIDQATRTATAKAIEDCRLTVVTPHQIRQRIENADAVIRSLMNILLKRYRVELARNRGFPVEAESALLDSAGIRKIRLENELKEALEAGRIQVMYQPIFRLADKSIAGVEALLRWDHPDRGMIPPTELVRLTEETDLFVHLDLYVLGTAIKSLVDFRARASDDFFISINVSVKHTRNQDFLNNARSICLATQQDVHNIMLELTESALVDIQQLSDWVQDAKTAGFKLCVDDFGTGFASLEYLTRISPDVIKVDRSFVLPLPDNPRIASVLRGILHLADDLNVKVIAEGAETTEHVDLLWGLGYDMAQGYALGHPLTRAQILDLLTDRQFRETSPDPQS